MKQATERTDENKEKKVTFVTNTTDKHPEERPTKEEEPVTRKLGRPKGSKTTTKDKTTITTRLFTRRKKG